MPFHCNKEINYDVMFWFKQQFSMWLRDSRRVLYRGEAMFAVLQVSLRGLSGFMNSCVIKYISGFYCSLKELVNRCWKNTIKSNNQIVLGRCWPARTGTEDDWTPGLLITLWTLMMAFI